MPNPSSKVNIDRLFKRIFYIIGTTLVISILAFPCAGHDSRESPVVLAVRKVSPAVVNISSEIEQRVNPFSKFGMDSGYYYAAVVPSIRQVAQLVGRLRRSPSDSGIVVLLDNRFLKHLLVFGDDIVSDVWPYEDITELTQAITQFNQLREEFS